MKLYNRWIVPLALLLALGTIVPNAATAQSSPDDELDRCTEEYYWCLNDTWDTTGWDRIIADLSCKIQQWGCEILEFILPS